MKKMVLVVAMAMIMMVGCGSEPMKPAELSPEGTETILQENVLEENIIEENVIRDNILREGVRIRYGIRCK